MMTKGQGTMMKPEGKRRQAQVIGDDQWLCSTPAAWVVECAVVTLINEWAVIRIDLNGCHRVTKGDVGARVW